MMIYSYVVENKCGIYLGKELAFFNEIFLVVLNG